MHQMKKCARASFIIRLRWLLQTLTVLCLSFAFSANAEYVRPSTEPYTQADLASPEGNSKTVVVRLINLTPYTLTQDLSKITASVSLDRNRKTQKSMMIAPVGWPGTLLPLKGQWEANETIGGAYAFIPSADNSSVHPYSFVVAWDDNGGDVPTSIMAWTAKSVYSSVRFSVNGVPDVKDVPIGLWFTRVNPKVSFYSEIRSLIFATYETVKSFLELLMEPENGWDWISLLIGVDEIKNSTKELNNLRDDGTAKLYFAAYPIPTCSSCSPSVITYQTTNSQTTATDDGDADSGPDAVDANWAAFGEDHYTSNLVVTTDFQRGFVTPGVGFGSTSNPKRIPTVTVIVWEPGLYALARSGGLLSLTSNPLAARLKSVINLTSSTSDSDAVRQQKLARVHNFLHLYMSLNPKQQKSFNNALDQLVLNESLQKDEKDLLEKIALALEQGRTTLQPENPGPSHPQRHMQRHPQGHSQGHSQWNGGKCND